MSHIGGSLYLPDDNRPQRHWKAVPLSICPCRFRYTSSTLYTIIYYTVMGFGGPKNQLNPPSTICQPYLLSKIGEWVVSILHTEYGPLVHNQSKMQIFTGRGPLQNPIMGRFSMGCSPTPHHFLWLSDKPSQNKPCLYKKRNKN